ncbi:hypothetical protein V1512DRAFT_207205 [Lipomyces arxii]|uniref:uncharacterized protein n=1 Tax=Lipomyces arxii TaxID=56418 RepID=UPI0034CD51BF
MTTINSLAILFKELRPDSEAKCRDFIGMLVCEAVPKLSDIKDLMQDFEITPNALLMVIYLYHLANQRFKPLRLTGTDYKAIYDFLVEVDCNKLELDDNLAFDFIESLARLRLLRKLTSDVLNNVQMPKKYAGRLADMSKSWMVFYEVHVIYPILIAFSN